METPAATKLDTQINVRQRLKDLAIWQEEWKNHNAFFDMLIGAMEENSSQIDLQRAAEISRLRRRLELQQVRIPFEIPVETIKEMGYAALHRDLVTQYTQLTKADRLLWLNNLLFLLTPELRELKDKIARVRGWRSGGSSAISSWAAILVPERLRSSTGLILISSPRSSGNAIMCRSSISTRRKGLVLVFSCSESFVGVG